MRGKILILYYNFFVSAFVYYGLIFNIGDLGGDVFVNFALSGKEEMNAKKNILIFFWYVKICKFGTLKWGVKEVQKKWKRERH